MKISILEDRPWVVKEFVKELREREAEIQNIFYFCEKDSEYERSSEHMEQLEEELNVPIIRVESYDFEEKLDQCYSDPDIRFLFDMDLTGDYSAHFLERINVLYALEKLHGGDNRIWFYTTGPASAKEQLEKTFAGHIIPVDSFDASKELLYMDMNYVESNILQEG